SSWVVQMRSMVTPRAIAPASRTDGGRSWCHRTSPRLDRLPRGQVKRDLTRQVTGASRRSLLSRERPLFPALGRVVVGRADRLRSPGGSLGSPDSDDISSVITFSHYSPLTLLSSAITADNVKGRRVKATIADWRN